MKIKVISYNIMAGFCDWDFKETSKPVINKSRLENAKKLVKEENPDILCITEAYFASKNYHGIYMDYQKIFGYPYIDIRGTCAILSKYPIVFSSDFNRVVGKGLIAQIKMKGKDVFIDVVHPKVQFQEEERITYLKEFFKEIKRPLIVAGDFNSISALDKYDKDFIRNFKSKVLVNGFVKMTDEETDKIMKNMLEGKLIKYVESIGLIDSFRVNNKKFDFTVPTDFLSKDKSTGIRIDFIFCSDDIKILKSGIIKNQLSEKASDHYPIYAILDI